MKTEKSIRIMINVCDGVFIFCDEIIKNKIDDNELTLYNDNVHVGDIDLRRFRFVFDRINEQERTIFKNYKLGKVIK